MTAPESVTITDVALRDGLQNHPRTLPTDTKLALLARLLAAGVRSMEVASFVHPRMVPQMADAEEVVRRLPGTPDAELMVLVPNERGAQRALESGAQHMRIVLSCSEGHSRANTNRSVREGLDETRRAVDAIRASSGSVRVTAAVATAFVCPFDGIVPASQVERVVGSLVQMGIDEISISDTLGRADPGHVRAICRTMLQRHPDVRFGLHLHNTYGMGLANVVAGLDAGIRQFDAALGGIGGCPFAPGAAGNIATEDVVFMLHSMGLNTCVDLDQLAFAAADLAAALGSPLESAVSRALQWVA